MLNKVYFCLQRRLHKSPLLSESDGEVEEAKKTPPRRKKGSGAPVKIDLPASHAPEEGDEEEEEIPKEPLKTLVAALFLATGFVATTSSLAVTHESVPDIGNKVTRQFKVHKKCWGSTTFWSRIRTAD